MGPDRIIAGEEEGEEKGGIQAEGVGGEGKKWVWVWGSRTWAYGDPEFVLPPLPKVQRVFIGVMPTFRVCLHVGGPVLS